MAEISHYEVWQDEALVYETHGVKFPKGKAVKIVDSELIDIFRTDGVLTIREVPVVRKKAAPKSDAKDAKEQPTEPVEKSSGEGEEQPKEGAVTTSKGTPKKKTSAKKAAKKAKN